MLQEMALWSNIILMIAMVNIVWQLDKAAKLLQAMMRLLAEAVDEHE